MIAALAFSLLRVLVYGIMLGIGFWISKKITGFLDELFIVMSKRKMAELGEIL